MTDSKHGIFSDEQKRQLILAYIYSQAVVLPADANLWTALQEPETETPE